MFRVPSDGRIDHPTHCHSNQRIESQSPTSQVGLIEASFPAMIAADGAPLNVAIRGRIAPISTSISHLRLARPVLNTVQALSSTTAQTVPGGRYYHAIAVRRSARPGQTGYRRRHCQSTRASGHRGRPAGRKPHRHGSAHRKSARSIFAPHPHRARQYRRHRN